MMTTDTLQNPNHRSQSTVRRAAAAIGKGAAVGAGISLAFAAGKGVVDRATPDTGDFTVTHTVQYGETPWDIAERYNPNEDVRPMVDEMMKHDEDGVLQPGQKLEVPASDVVVGELPDDPKKLQVVVHNTTSQAPDTQK